MCGQGRRRAARSTWLATSQPRQLPTGDELIDEYLLPLANLPELRTQIHLNSRVTAISRQRIDKMKEAGSRNFTLCDAGHDQW